MLGEAGRLGVSLPELQAAIAEQIGVGTP